MTNEPEYSKCGFRCDLCPAFRENSGTEADRERGSAAWEKYFGLHFSPKIIRCEGCQSAAPWQSGNLLPDRRCVIRACAVYNGVGTCAHCSLFPCDEYTRIVPGSDLREKREAAAGVRFTDEEYRQNLEPFEGQSHLKRLRASLDPADIQEPRPLPADPAIFPFQATEHSRDDETMRRLHTLLARVLSAPQSGSYAGHLLWKRNAPYLKGILWVMGLHGQLKDGRLVLESTACGSIKECTRLVRKTDNQLHGAVQEAVKQLREAGLQVEFTPAGKSWTLYLGLEEEAGGSAMLAALQKYVRRLAESHGTPVYAGSYELKGKAFKLFSIADMRTA